MRLIRDPAVVSREAVLLQWEVSKEQPRWADLETMFSGEGEHFILDHAWDESMLDYIMIWIKEVGAL